MTTLDRARAPQPVGALLHELRLTASLTADERRRRTPRQSGPLTQDEAGRRVGVDRETWNKWENDRRGLSETSARRIAQAFGYPEDELLKLTGARRAGAALEAAARLEELVARADAAADRLETLLERAEATQDPLD